MEGASGTSVSSVTYTDCYVLNARTRIAAYFTQGTIDHLRSVDDIPELAALVVPEGHFKSTRVGKNRSKQNDESRGESSKSSSNRQYAAFPSPYATTSPAIENQSVMMYDPYQGASSHSGYYHSQQQDQDQPQSRTHSSSPHHRSSGSLSPPADSPRIQYPGQVPQFGPNISHGEAKPSRLNGSIASVHQSHPHPSEYRALPSLSGQSPIGALHDGNGQRGKPVINSSYTESSGLNNRAFDQPADSYASWDTQSSASSYTYPTHDTATLQLSHSASVPMHSSGDPGQSINGYMYQLQRPQQQVYTAAMSQHSLVSMGHQYDYPQTDMFLPQNPSSVLAETPRTPLPPVHVLTEDPPPYGLSPTLAPQQQSIVGPLSSTPPIPPTNTSQRAPTVRSRALAPLYALNRPHPYKRDYQDDKALRLLQNASAASPPH